MIHFILFSAYKGKNKRNKEDVMMKAKPNPNLSARNPNKMAVKAAVRVFSWDVAESDVAKIFFFNWSPIKATPIGLRRF